MTRLITAGGASIEEIIPVIGDKATYNITAPTVLKVGPGRLGVVSMLNWGSAAGAIYDGASTAGNTAANQIGVLATNAFATTEFNFPFTNGLVIVPGTGQAVSVSFL
jgi:hypothetical protein